MMVNPFLFFVKSTIGMLLERASWNDDNSYEELTNLTIEDVYADQMDEDGNIYDCLIFDQADAENNQEFMFGSKEDLNYGFEKTKEILINYGYLKEFYDDHKCMDLDDCLILAESLHSLV